MTLSPPHGVDTTTDHLLGGRVALTQPRQGYRAGVDAVLLAASVTPRAGQHVLDMGCGVGAVALCVNARVPGVVLSGVEGQGTLAALATENARANGADFTIYHADIADLPAPLRQIQFDHVLANPPYFEDHAIGVIADPVRDRAHREDIALAQWFEVGARRLSPKGSLTMIQRMERLPEMLAAAEAAGLGGLSALPIAGRVGRAPDRVILRAHKGRKTPFSLRPTLHLHQGRRHEADRPDYTEEVQQVLKEARPLPGLP